MAAMGLGTGSGQAWDTEQTNLGQNENDADLKAILAGVNQGNTEFGQGMQLHTTGTGDILNQNTANLQKVGGMMGHSNSFRMPTFGAAPTPGMNPNVTPNLVGAADASYQAAVDKANAQNASDPWNQIVGIGTKLAGAYLGAPNVKADVPQTQTNGQGMMSSMRDWFNK